MSKMQFITCKQNKILKSFTCERLTNDSNNRMFIKNFVNSRNKHLEQKLTELGWEEDEKGESAYYIIKRNNKIALYFSIKTGLLFDEEKTESDLNKKIDAQQNELTNVKTKIGKYKISGTVSTAIIKSFLKNVKNVKRMLSFSERQKELFLNDKLKEPNKKLNYVQTTYPGIELHLFCANENFKKDWELLGINPPNNRMGIILFWKFIIPKIIEIKRIVGCKYLYLFAADSTPDQTLISYYNILKFQQNNSISTSKPSYDWSCFFMVQEINNLCKERKLFFQNFNLDPSIPIA